MTLATNQIRSITIRQDYSSIDWLVLLCLINNKMKAILGLLLMLCSAMGQQFLQNVYIDFALQGTVNYLPTSGGIAIPGYTFKLGFDRFSWLGIMFMTATSYSNYDTLILQRSAQQNGGLYTCSIKDYYVSTGRPNSLMSDTITNMDQVVTSSSKSNYFTLTMPRTVGNTNGEDWQGGQFTSICFFTSDIAFSESTWTQQYQVCYGYQVSNYVSTHRGSYLATMNFQGVSSAVYGGIYGPVLNLQLFWYRQSTAMTNNTGMIIQIGGQISSLVGNDYYQCGVGDFYGTSTGGMLRDLYYSGYEDGSCQYIVNANSVMLAYSRNAYTSDVFDNVLTLSIDICLIGAQTGCSSIYLPFIYPIMSVSSALIIFQRNMAYSLLLVVFLLLTMI